MNRSKALQSKSKGSVIVLTAIALVVLLIVGMGLLELGAHSRIFAAQRANEISARCAADAGLAKALFEMNEKIKAKPWTDSGLPNALNEMLPNSDAIYSYTTTTSIVDGNNVYTVESIGKSGNATKQVTCTLDVEGLFEYAIFAQGNILLRQGTTVDWYNFDADDPPLQLGTNSTQAGAIIAKTGVTINGDVLVGAGGNPSTVVSSLSEAAITGCSYPLIEAQTLPLITVPAYLQSLPSQGSITTSKTITSSGKYDSINLLGNGQSDTVTIDSVVELYVIGDVRLGQGDVLQINPNASLTLYLGGNLLVDNDSTINNVAKDPHKLKIYGLAGCQSIDFKAKSTIYGAIYAPNAAIHSYNSAEIYGSLIGKSFVQDVFAGFHYDASLREVSANEIGVRFVVKQWREE